MEKPALRAADYRFDRAVSREPASTRIYACTVSAQRAEVGVTHEMLVARRRAGLCDRSTRFRARLYA